MSQPSAARVLFEAVRPPSLGIVRVYGTEHEIRAPRVRQYAEYVRLSKRINDAKGKGDPDGEFAAAVDLLCLCVPSLPRTEVEDMELEPALKLIEAVTGAVDERVAAKAEAATSDPSSGTSSAPPAGGPPSSAAADATQSPS